jgi:hypothetical protein
MMILLSEGAREEEEEEREREIQQFIDNQEVTEAR